ncbi:hypothetical protein AOLI_G00170470 [Acnodon oligacanthus]
MECYKPTEHSYGEGFSHPPPEAQCACAAPVSASKAEPGEEQCCVLTGVTTAMDSHLISKAKSSSSC